MRLAALMAAMTAALMACTPGSGGGNRSGGSTGGTGGSGSSTDTGGVDVGNMTSASVPQTNASVTYPGSWMASTAGGVLTLKNKSGSQVTAKKSEITDLTSPTAISLQQYLKAKFPNRTYTLVNINGLEGVRADIEDTAAAKRSDIYLVSELKDFVHVESDLKAADGGITAGDQILLTVRVEYRGLAYPSKGTKTVTLPAYDFKSADYQKAAYSMLGDCYSYVDSGCRGVAILFANGGGVGLDLGVGGYDNGRIIEMGSESQVPFDQIKIDGKYLVAPLARTPLADIYTAFTPKDMKPEQDRIELKEGHVYLMRMISWPEEDLVAKVRVDKLTPGKSVTLTYEKLAYVDPKELQKQVDAINKHTVDFEQPLATGEVTLYNRSVWNNYYFASFNFQYSTSGNMFLTRNSWDLTFGTGCSGDLAFSVPHSGSGLGLAADLGTKDVASITAADFPDPNAFKRDCGTKAVKGHTYAVYNFDGDQATYGAVQVLDVDPGKSWIRLKFRRIKIGPAEYFQKWIDLAVPAGIQQTTLEYGQGQKGSFLPFINKRGDQGRHYYESIDFTGDSLSTDSRPYGTGRGFKVLPKGTVFENVTGAQIEALRGKFDRDLPLHQGDLVAVLLDNFYDKTVMVMRVDGYAADKTVQLSMRYLYRGKTAYSEDKD